VANPGGACKSKQAKNLSVSFGYAALERSSSRSRFGCLKPGLKPMTQLVVMKKAVKGEGQATLKGRLRAGSLTMPCAIGASGILHDKREGDRATPAGTWQLLNGFYRPDRGPRPKASRPLQPLHPDMGWCDDPASAAYNRPVRLPFGARHEILWRNDGLYDVIIVLGHNLHPRRKNRGSAIFLHCARDDLAPTAGCIALRPADLRRLLPRLSAKTVLIVR
jgi:L,D-peptidoglycan transpeptidase YkuD (ErfK/YbiS/YcfS/YnhG family)